ncbi:MAG: nickel/cobalt transporter [Xanthobacteraceae bacterium]|jgi:nickel/cobalt exporter
MTARQRSRVFRSNRARDTLVITSLAILAGGLVSAVADVALAQGAFGIGRTAPQPADGVFGWLLAQQASYYRGFASMIRAAKADGSAVYGLLGLSFTYGILHAAGPGHGKAVISSYLIANGETWRRGVVLSFASAFLQALAAVAMVGIAAAMLGATAATMGSAVRVIEIASYLIIIAVGVRLCLAKGRGLLRELQRFRSTHHAHDEAHGHAHPLGVATTAPGADDGHAHHHHDHHHTGHDHDHGTCEICDHSHGPEPRELAGPGGWQRGLAAIVAVGLRPCSGAILVLVFALAQGLFWVGVASTFVMGFGTAVTVAAIATLAVGAGSLARKLATARDGVGALAMRGIEVAASILIVAFGVLLLTGYMANERLFGG